MKVGVHRMRGRIDLLQQRFAATQVSDARAEQMARRYAWLIGGSLVAAIGGVWFPPISVAAVGLVVIFAGLHAHAKQGDLNDRKLGAVHKLLTMLAVDTPGGSGLNPAARTT